MNQRNASVIVQIQLNPDLKRGLIMKLRFTCLLFAAALCLCSFCYTPSEENLKLHCVSCVLIDQYSGRILYAKNSDKILAMASTTKIVTALVAIEKGNLDDSTIVSKRAASVKGSAAGLKEGEEITLEELLYGLMLRSGNDAAIAIAEMLGGNVHDFVKLMNDKAMELGAYNTSFATPHGLDASDHYTTAQDLAKLTAYAMNNETFAQIVSTKETDSGYTGKFNRSYRNINKFLYRIDNSDGVKTGFTGNAGKCLVASVKHPYGRYICVVLNSSNRWQDAETLMSYASKTYSFIKLYKKGETLKRICVYGEHDSYIQGRINNDIYLPIKEDEKKAINVKIYVPSFMFTPIVENEPIGSIVVTINNQQEAKYMLYSDRTVKR
jgi:D-alanyl-D-alanine carboxypeptidase (penicillin-binding protein 5/6)